MFSSAEEEELKGVLSELGIPADRRVSAEKLVQDWFAIVDTVEQGYKLTADDYADDLDARQLLEEFRTRASSEAQRKLDLLLDPPDRQFIGATRRTRTPIVGDPSPDEWWWWRLPLRGAPELERTLRLRNFDLSAPDA